MRPAALFTWLAASKQLATASRVPPIQDSQNATSPEFIGSDACPRDLGPKFVALPRTTQMHQNGNMGSVDDRGPIQVRTKLGSVQTIVTPMLWGDDGTLMAATATGFQGTPNFKMGVAAYDPETLEELTSWFPDPAVCGNSTLLNIPYSQLRLKDNTLVTSCGVGKVFVLQRRDEKNGTSLILKRQIDVKPALQEGETLLTTSFDTLGNIWFTTGTLTGVETGNSTSATVGFIRTDDSVSVYHLSSLVNENGVALNGTTVWVITGPPQGSPPNTPAYMYSFNTTEKEGRAEIQLNWQSAAYSTGSERKPGKFAAGAGATVGMLGDDYVVTTDNDDEGMNLLVYHQEAQATPESQLFCKIRLFNDARSINDNRVTVHYDETGYRVVVQNMQGVPSFRQNTTDINGPWNDMSAMPGDLVQIRVAPENCYVQWRNKIAMKTVPLLSTKTGIYYGYTQDKELASRGQYVYYFVAIDWESGIELWRRRAGTGGNFDDGFAVLSIGKNGHVYQVVRNGTVWIEDHA